MKKKSLTQSSLEEIQSEMQTAAKAIMEGIYLSSLYSISDSSQMY